MGLDELQKYKLAAILVFYLQVPKYFGFNKYTEHDAVFAAVAGSVYILFFLGLFVWFRKDSGRWWSGSSKWLLLWELFGLMVSLVALHLPIADRDKMLIFGFAAAPALPWVFGAKQWQTCRPGSAPGEK